VIDRKLSQNADALIRYYSLTGNVRRFVNKLGLPCKEIGDDAIQQPYVLITCTVGFGEVPAPVTSFLRRNGKWVIGVAASGNRNWGRNFAKAADRIAHVYGVPVLHKFELSGSIQDVQVCKERMKQVVQTYRVKQLSQATGE